MDKSQKNKIKNKIQSEMLKNNTNSSLNIQTVENLLQIGNSPGKEVELIGNIYLECINSLDFSAISQKESDYVESILANLISEKKNNGGLEEWIIHAIDDFRNQHFSVFILSTLALIDFSLALKILPIPQVKFKQIFLQLESSDMSIKRFSLRLLTNLSSYKEPRHQISEYWSSLDTDPLFSIISTELESQTILLLAKLSSTSQSDKIINQIDPSLLSSKFENEQISESFCFLTLHYEFKKKCVAIINQILQIRNIPNLTTILKNLAMSNEDMWITQGKNTEITAEETKSIQEALTAIMPHHDSYSYGPHDSIVSIRDILNTNNAQRFLLDLWHEKRKEKHSELSKKELIFFLFLMSESSAMRIPILQHRGATLLIKYGDLLPVISGHTLGRLLISTNPRSFTHDLLMNSVLFLINALKNAWHQLTEFEVLLALTNLAGFAEEIREFALNDGIWETAFQLILSENPMIVRSACELISNLVMSEIVIKDLIAKKKAKNIEILILMLKCGDKPTLSAILGTLANISRYKQLQYLFKEDISQKLENLLKNETELPIIARILAIISHVPSICTPSLVALIRAISEPSLQKYVDFIINSQNQ